MRCYHRTFSRDARAAFQAGFVDHEGNSRTGHLWSGVAFADAPLDRDVGFDGDVLLSVELPDELFALYEWRQDGPFAGDEGVPAGCAKPYRESLIPAALVNAHGPPRLEGADFMGAGREQVERAIARLESACAPGESVNRLHELLAFLDERGILEPVS
jgi:hypothetical protein